jgi:glutathione S-transferase
MITLSDMSLSGNCHKVRLLLSFIALPYQTRPDNLAGGEQRSLDYLQCNPFGQVPVLDDDGLIIRALPGYVTMPGMWQA